MTKQELIDLLKEKDELLRIVLIELNKYKKSEDKKNEEKYGYTVPVV